LSRDFILENPLVYDNIVVFQQRIVLSLPEDLKVAYRSA
jgi:hypothetical protein